MKIAVIGMGGIGSTFALHFARAGHDVTAVARGKRLAQLEARGGVATGAEVVPVAVAGALDPETPFDLVIVAVLADQVGALLPALGASAARKIAFAFNFFAPLSTLRDVVGAERFAFAFPSILARIEDDGRLVSNVQRRGLLTTVSDEALRDLLVAAEIPAVVEPDLESWLRAHVAAVAPFMIAVGRAYGRNAGISWREATELAAAMHEGFDLVRSLGNHIVPTPVAVLAKMPRTAVAGVLWTTTRSAELRASGAAGMREPRALIDAMLAVAPTPLPALSLVRPD